MNHWNWYEIFCIRLKVDKLNILIFFSTGLFIFPSPYTYRQISYSWNFMLIYWSSKVCMYLYKKSQSCKISLKTFSLDFSSKNQLIHTQVCLLFIFLWISIHNKFEGTIVNHLFILRLIYLQGGYSNSNKHVWNDLL